MVLENKKFPNRIQMRLSDRHRDLLQEVMDLLEIDKREAVSRAIEGLHKVACMQKRREQENRQ